MLGEAQTNWGNLHGGRLPSFVAFSNGHFKALRCRERGPSTSSRLLYTMMPIGSRSESQSILSAEVYISSAPPIFNVIALSAANVTAGQFKIAISAVIFPPRGRRATSYLTALVSAKFLSTRPSTTFAAELTQSDRHRVLRLPRRDVAAIADSSRDSLISPVANRTTITAAAGSSGRFSPRGPLAILGPSSHGHGKPNLNFRLDSLCGQVGGNFKLRHYPASRRLDTPNAPDLSQTSGSRARSSAGEHSLHTRRVTGSIPVAPTNLLRCASRGAAPNPARRL